MAVFLPSDLHPLEAGIVVSLKRVAYPSVAVVVGMVVVEALGLPVIVEGVGSKDLVELKDIHTEYTYILSCPPPWGGRGIGGGGGANCGGGVCGGQHASCRIGVQTQLIVNAVAWGGICCPSPGSCAIGGGGGGGGGGQQSCCTEEI
uniref:Candidate secreted effector n=1 Tax=Meloidogyne incognita TaxID=6306 RepID=A0A914LPM5_MELIC